MTYKATLRGYEFGDGEPWVWVNWPSGVGPGAYRTDRAPAPGRGGEVALGPDYAGAGQLVFELRMLSTAALIEAEAFLLRQAFAPVSNGGELLELTWESAGGTYVVRGRPEAPALDLNDAKFGKGLARVSFQTLDPLWYSVNWQQVTATAGGATGGIASPPVSPPVTTGGSSGADKAVFNGGTASAPWTMQLNGPLTTPSLMLNGLTVELYPGEISAGSVAYIDSRTRSVTLDGNPRAWVSFGSVWWDIPPGSSTFSLRATAGTGTATLMWRDANY